MNQLPAFLSDLPAWARILALVGLAVAARLVVVGNRGVSRALLHSPQGWRSPLRRAD